MKLHISASEYDELPQLTKVFWSLWFEEKGYAPTKEIHLEQMIELAFALTPDLHFDDSDGRTFNNILTYDELMIAFDGSQLTDAAWYEVNKKIRQRILLFDKSSSTR
jgi:hypothetical protein